MVEARAAVARAVARYQDAKSAAHAADEEAGALRVKADRLNKPAPTPTADTDYGAELHEEATVHSVFSQTDLSIIND